MTTADTMRGRRTLVRAFISEAEQAELVAWALAMQPYLSANGEGRTFRKVEHLPEEPDLYHEVRQRLEAVLAVPGDAQREPMFGWYVSVISDGGAVHSHMDPTEPGMRHLRCNLFLQLPRDGGLPLIEGQRIRVTERSLLAFFPSEERHASQSVEGDRQRIICSFGYLVPLAYEIPDLLAPGETAASSRAPRGEALTAAE